MFYNTILKADQMEKQEDNIRDPLEPIGFESKLSEALKKQLLLSYLVIITHVQSWHSSDADSTIWDCS